MNFIQKLIGRGNSGKKNPIEIRESDVFLVSYPKSGNTWLRFLIGNYLSKGEMDFSNGHIYMPDIHYNPEQIEKIVFHPRFIKSHFSFKPEYKNVIYLVRDGREVAVSLYYFLVKMKVLKKDIEFSDYLENYFYTGKTPFGHWNKHIFSWLRDNKPQNLMVVKYEDLIADTMNEFEKIINFSGLILDKEILRIAVDRSSFDSMKKDEELNTKVLNELGHDTTDTTYRIIRAGRTNSWQMKFTIDESKKFLDLYGDALEFLGYSK